MRCEEMTRELALSTGLVEPSELAEHLAVCPCCADFADRSRQLDKLWEATRPVPPPPAAWNAVWERVVQATEPATIPLSAPGRGRRRVLVTMALAQAAVLLIAALAVIRGLPGGDSSRKPEVVVQHDAAEDGATLFICLDEQGRRVDCGLRLTTPEQILASDDFEDGASSFTLAWDMEFINSMEGAE